MNKAYYHDWIALRFNWSECTTCHCLREVVPQHSLIPSSLTKYPQFKYFRNGIQLPRRPNCKRIMHSDNLN
jgi:hypothetical protein